MAWGRSAVWGVCIYTLRLLNAGYAVSAAAHVPGPQLYVELLYRAVIHVKLRPHQLQLASSLGARWCVRG